MKNLRKAWNMADSILSKQSPAILNEELMSHIAGGERGDKPGSGLIKTISGECRKDGKSCWELVKELLEPTITGIF